MLLVFRSLNETRGRNGGKIDAKLGTAEVCASVGFEFGDGQDGDDKSLGLPLDKVRYM